MLQVKWLSAYISLCFIVAFYPAFSRGIQALPEGFDRQSEAEIAIAKKRIEALGFDLNDEPIRDQTAVLRVFNQYGHLDPKHEVPQDLLEQAILFFAANKEKFANQRFITIVDFGPRSDTWRMFVVDLASGLVEKYHTTHGIGSDQNRDGWAESFGNVINSGKSSLGFAYVAEIYSGKYGRSIRLDGLSRSNSNLRPRAVVVHGWDGVKEKHVIQGLSWGCITLDWTIKDSVIDKIAEGSLMLMGKSSVN